MEIRESERNSSVSLSQLGFGSAGLVMSIHFPFLKLKSEATLWEGQGTPVPLLLGGGGGADI